MHLRLPLVVGVVGLAVAAAFVRAHAPAAVPSAALSMSSPSASAAASLAPSVRRSQTQRAAAETIVVYVAGDVVRTGIYTLSRRSRAADALRAAGGARADADLVALNLAAPLADGDEVAVMAKNAVLPAAPRRSRRVSGVTIGEPQRPARRRKRKAPRKRHAGYAGSAVSTGRPAEADAASDAPREIVDLNRADASELESLPGIGAALAERIVAVREASGPFASADDLLDVGGMTQGRLDALLPYITVR